MDQFQPRFAAIQTSADGFAGTDRFVGIGIVNAHLSQGPKEACVITADVGWIAVSRRSQTDRGTHTQYGKYPFHHETFRRYPNMLSLRVTSHQKA